jgi:putative transposase
MAIRRAGHCVYDLRYHLVWTPTYRKWVLQGAVGELLKAVSAKEIREEFPEVRTHRWGRKFWEDGYCVRTVGDKVTADVIRKYIRFHEAKKRGAEQFFQKAPPGRAGFFTHRATCR